MTGNAAARSASDSAYQAEWAPFEYDPGPLVFVLGCQRSGTTWLHRLLARSGAFRFLSAYDVHAYDRLVLDHRQGRVQAARRSLAAELRDVRDRGIDDTPAEPDTPEEYGLILSAAADDQVRYARPDTTSATLPLLRQLCAKTALLEGTERPLLLKSPPDYPHALERLARAWPAARFVTVHRHPLRTLDSQLRAWRHLIRAPNAYLRLIDPGYRRLLDDPGRRMRLGLLLHAEAGVSALADQILDAHRAFVIREHEWAHRSQTLRYEDLIADPHGVWERLSAFLDVPLRAPAEEPSPRRASVCSEARRAYGQRTDRFAPYLARFGYASTID